jgi:hypothetical protein
MTLRQQRSCGVSPQQVFCVFFGLLAIFGRTRAVPVWRKREVVAETRKDSSLQTTSSMQKNHGILKKLPPDAVLSKKLLHLPKNEV